MARTSLIDIHDLASLCATLYFEEGRTVEETTAAINVYMSDVRKSDVTVSKSAVGRWIQAERAGRASVTNEQIREWAADEVQSDLQTLNLLKTWHMKQWADEKLPLKERRLHAKDCLDVITVKIRIAQAADSGDKTEIYQILKNEINTVGGSNPLQDLLEEVSGATRGLPNMEQSKIVDAEFREIGV